MRTPTKKELPKTHTCQCGAIHKFCAWVYAHWNEKLTFKCPECKSVSTILRGKVLKIVTEGKPKQDGNS
jgi:phage FluMu protein Com